jgi:hypothetical protein
MEPEVNPMSQAGKIFLYMNYEKLKYFNMQNQNLQKIL